MRKGENRMNKAIFESKLKGLLKEFQTKITMNEMEEIAYRVVEEVIGNNREYKKGETE